MKCYVHQNTDAVGVCSSCGRGVCRDCAVKLGGRIYCGDDADRAFRARRTVVQPLPTSSSRRGVGVVLGSLFAYLLGGTATILSFLVLFAAMVSGDTGSTGLFSSLFNPDLSFLGTIQRSPSNLILETGLAMLFFGCWGIGAGFYLWRPSRVGAVFTVIFGLMGVFGAFELSSRAVIPLLIDAWFALSGLTIATSFIAFVQLTKPRESAPPITTKSADPSRISS